MAQSAARPAEQLTKAQDARYSLMRRAGITQQTITDALAGEGKTLSRQSVNGVIRNRFANEDVIRVFCRLTKTPRAKAWPDVPPPQRSR